MRRSLLLLNMMRGFYLKMVRECVFSEHVEKMCFLLNMVRSLLKYWK